MNVLDSAASYVPLNHNVAEASSRTAVFNRTAQKSAETPGVQDLVEISAYYRDLQSAASGVWADNSYQMNTSTKDVFAGASVAELRNYLLNMAGDLSLAGINASRESIGRRIDSVIKGAGIDLGKDEKISISVGKDNKIKVAGIKDKGKIQAIEEALNNDKTLGQNIRRHFAQGKINNHANSQGQFMKNNPDWSDQDGDVNDMFTNRGLRSFVIDDYLREKTGVGLSDLGFDNVDGTGTIRNVDANLAALFAEDPTLAETVANILENGEQSLDFEINFEFSNGSIADGETENAAKEKLRSIQEIVMGLLDEYNDKLIGEGGAAAEGMEELTANGFSIRASKGGFEIVGAENMDPMKVRNLTGIIERALYEYSQMGTDPYTGGAAVGSFDDVAAAFIETHRFHHGDTEEFPHELEIGFYGMIPSVEVVSDAADDARDDMNQGISDELGKELRAVLEEQGVDVGEGIQVELNENGKMTIVGGDLSEAERKKAQAILDSFAEQSKSSGLAEAQGDDPIEDNRVENERYAMRPGKQGDKYDKLNNETNPGGTFSPNVGVFEKPEKPNTDDNKGSRTGNQSIVESINASYRDNTEVFSGGGLDKVSLVKDRKYVSREMAANLTAGPGGLPSIWDEHKMYSDDAKGKYLHLLDSMGQFHNPERGKKYTFTIA